MIHSTKNLGVKKSSLKLEEDHLDLNHFQTMMELIVHWVVDLTTYRPPAYSWTNGCRTFVAKLNNNPQTLLSFADVLNRCPSQEYSYFVTEEKDIFVRIYWA